MVRCRAVSGGDEMGERPRTIMVTDNEIKERWLCLTPLHSIQRAACEARAEYTRHLSGRMGRKKNGEGEKEKEEKGRLHMYNLDGRWEKNRGRT